MILILWYIAFYSRHGHATIHPYSGWFMSFLLCAILSIDSEIIKVTRS